MTTPSPPSRAGRDPGAVAVTARAMAPDLARGLMLLFIAVANVQYHVYGVDPGVRGYPRDATGADAVVAGVKLMLVDGRAYPLFGLLFGYGVTQLATRRAAAGVALPQAVRIIRRRGWMMVLIGAVHGLLLFSGDIVAAYGLVGVVLAGLLVSGRPRALLWSAGVGIGVSSLLGTIVGLEAPVGTGALLASAEPSALAAFLRRLVDWPLVGLLSQVLAVVGAVVLGAFAARFRLLEEPERHRALLVRLASVGIPVAVLGAVPVVLTAVGAWQPGLGLALASGFLHTLTGFAGGVGFAALFGLVAIRLRARPGAVTRALVATGQRSLSSYLAQTLLFVPLLPAWTLGLGGGLTTWQATLLAVGVWLVTVVLAAAMARSGVRGPAETLLRRLTYGSRTGS